MTVSRVALISTVPACSTPPAASEAPPEAWALSLATRWHWLLSRPSTVLWSLSCCR